MRVLVSGASGLLGTAIGKALEAEASVVTRLVRSGAASEKQIVWEPGKPLALPSPFDAVIHLAGEPVVQSDHRHAEVEQFGDDPEQRPLLAAVLCRRRREGAAYLALEHGTP